ncbi:hypothetical protein KM176_17195 [Pseudooceanicola sp. CBS1P-1]|uniref:Histidinol phosphate aminotransferase n=1 Tax=Pseudooceanicola albus TaxID=2692189 RepID=A0A6L7G542_9RHOB|nr:MULTISPECIES: hypothetical protein [Pseudooceanicola]MBT9385611.1 hypothetical protein [Pseudooceanicola endophyticus]MXN18979.1 hypothetical protein [Pseudooceanicola albus]
MSYARPPFAPPAPNYTTPVLVMGFVNLLWIFGFLWAAFGIQWVLVAGYLLNLAIRWLARRRAA